MDSSVGEPRRKRQQRDSWDDEYDRGKVSCYPANKGYETRNKLHVAKCCRGATTTVIIC